MADDEGKFRESIWSIHPNWRGWFYGVLSFCGVAVSAFTLYDEWGKGWLEIFNEIRDGIVSSVVVVWFLFQVTESVMGAYQYFTDLRDAHRKEREDRLRDEIAKEEQERREQFVKEVVKLLEKNNAPQADIQQVQYISDSLKPPNYP